MKLLVVFVLMLCIIILYLGFGFAQETPFKEQLVYSLTSFNGSTFSKSFCPQSEEVIYLIANQNNVLSPTKTIVYYWPITRRYMAGFSTLNEKISGTLEILQNGKVIATQKEQKYVLYYPKGYWSEKAVMYLDAEADTYHQKYKQAIDAFNQKLREYYQAMEWYREALNRFFEEVHRRREAGEEGPLNIPIPKEPQPPSFVDFYASDPAFGFILNLPPGKYEIRLHRDDGTIFEGSEKKLVVFTSRRQGGVGYEIIPGNRWTKKESCDDPSWIIHAAGKNDLYFNPYKQEEYNELYYNKLVDPQEIGRIERFKWVHIDPVEEVTLLFGRGKEILQTVEKAPYFVKQIPGPELGYEILVYNEELQKKGYKPTFESYKVSLSEDLPKTDYQISVVSKSSGQIEEKSERTVRLIKKENAPYLYIVSFLPLAVGAVVILGRIGKIEK